MTYKVVLTKSFSSDLRKLVSQGHKRQALSTRAAMTEAGTVGSITSIPRTKHGETRIQNVEKYELGDGYRMVVQLVDAVNKTRAFLFVGSHDDAEKWLDVHKNYKWVKSATDGVLEFVLVTIPASYQHVPADRLNLEASEEQLQRPILHGLSKNDWDLISLNDQAKLLVDSISGADFEQDAEGILEKLSIVAGYQHASLLLDLMWHSHAGEPHQLRKRIALLQGSAEIIDSEQAADAMSSVQNSEAFITFDDNGLLDKIFENGSIADWMLFLHPEQKMVVDRELRGPARLRGVSGSGKTCVLVHRCRSLAKKYNQPILLVTLTESMRKLLERLVDDLCGVERSLITIKTMGMLAKDTLSDSSVKSTHYPYANAEVIDEGIRASTEFVKKHLDFSRSSFKSMSQNQLSSFIRTELFYVRGRLQDSALAVYLDGKAFQRSGRGAPLSQMDRRIILDAIAIYREVLNRQNLYDHEGVVSMALTSVQRPEYKSSRFRSVLADEVQDLSELDITLLGRLKSPNGELIAEIEDGLFLAGDGAQSIYKRGFSLRRTGIDIVGRSFSLKKNYRNTHEILKAAFGLVSEYEFADVDEEDMMRPSVPDFAHTHGSRPVLIRCVSSEEEVEFVAKSICSSLAMGQSAGQICVIAPSQKLRADIEQALKSRSVSTAELRNDVDYESENVKISTIESAKGHEFSAVYILGLVEGTLPMTGTEDIDIPREASRLYVAMTRAREKLVMTYSPRLHHGASRFLIAIQADCDEAHIRDGQIRRIE